MSERRGRAEHEDLSDDAPRMPAVGVGVIVEREGRVLLARRKNDPGKGTWAPPGGHLDFGEEPEACAAREVEEETGLRIGRPRFRALTNDVFPENGAHYVSLWMDASFAAGEAWEKSKREMEGLGWFAWEDLPEPLFEPFRHLLEGRSWPKDAMGGVAGRVLRSR